MFVPLIPMFLAAFVAVEDGQWEYGPEAIYNVQFNAVAHPQGSSALEGAMTNSTLKLKCRLQYHWVLNCHFEEVRHVLTMTKPGKSQVMKDNKDFGQDGPGEDAFQLKFNPEGFNDIVVPSSIHPAKLDMIRALLGPMNIGTDVSEEKASGTFNRMEKFANGVCNATIDMIVQSDAERDPEIQEKSYRLMNMRGALYTGLTLKELRKSRRLNECLFRTNYFYGSRETARAEPSGIESEIKSSEAKMTLSKNMFTSYNENVVAVSDKKKSTSTIITERITLTLENIVPADGPMPKIVDPVRARIFPTTGFFDDSSEESQDTKSGQVLN